MTMNKPELQSMPASDRRRWLVALATLAVMGTTASLGVWQLSRAAQKRTLEAMIDSRASLSPWTEAELARPETLEDGMHRRARLAGAWDARHTVFLDNRPMNGRSGFIVVTPFRLRGLSGAILVQRGWVPRDFTDRTRVPMISTPDGELSIEGRLAPPPSHLFELGQAQPGRIRQNIDLQAFAQETGLPLLNVSLLQTAPPSSELARDWPRFAAGVQKHYGYAFQWFAMCATAACLFVWFQIISPRRKLRSHGTEHR